MAIELAPDVRKQLAESIKRYFAEKMEEEIGDLKARFLLDYVLVEIGPCIYNQAIADAQAFLRDKVADLEGTCFEPEFEFWRKEKS